VRRILRPVEAQRPSLGSGFIGVGAAIVCGIRAVYGLGWFIGLWGTYPDPMPALLAWIVLITVLVVTFVTTRIIGDTLPD